MARYLIIVLSLLSLKTYASSCCGQAPTSFSVLSLNQKLSLTTSLSYTESVGRVYQDSDKFFVFDKKNRSVQNFNLNVASQLSERSQVFATISQSQGHFESNGITATSSHTSDTLMGWTYEAISEYRYSYWKPTVYISALVNLPTGRSIYDDQSLGEAAGVTGHNQYGVGLGLTLKKVYYPISLSLQLKSIELLSSKINNVEVSNFNDLSLSFLASYNFTSLTSSLGISYNQLSERTVNNQSSEGSNNTTVLVAIQTPINESLFLGVNYSDQTLIGKSKNTILNRNFGLSLNYNYF